MLAAGGLAGCAPSPEPSSEPSSEASEPGALPVLDATPDAPAPSCGPSVAGEAEDIGTRCAGSALDEPLYALPVGDIHAVGAGLPEGTALVPGADGVVRLTGTVPPSDKFLDASFDVRVDAVADGCVESAVFSVGFVIDPCDGGDGSCGPFARAVPVGGFCLPDHIDADTPFAVATIADACLSSTATEVRPALCDVRVQGRHVTVDGDACVRARNVDAFTQDCGGGDGAPCEVPALPAGTYDFEADGRVLPVTVPSSTTGGARCLFWDGHP